MIRLLTLVLVLWTAPALATPLLLLPGSTWDVDFAFRQVHLLTTEFEVWAHTDDGDSGIYQGMTFCQTSGHDCFDRTAPANIAVFGYQDLTATLPPECRFTPNPFAGDCPDGLYPVQVSGSVGFFVNDPARHVTFDFVGYGIGVNEHQAGIQHADFGLLPVPEPATWILVTIGLLVMARARHSFHHRRRC